MSLTATCHCGATRIQLPTHPTEAKSCNCSYCARTGAVWAYYRPDELTFVAREAEATYAVDERLNQHHFCGKCGMQTWGSSPDWSAAFNNDGTPKNGGDGTTVPTERIYAVNLNLVDDLDWSRVAVERMDGRNNW
jgi:hypothetical protein